MWSLVVDEQEPEGGVAVVDHAAVADSSAAVVDEERTCAERAW